MTPVTPIIDFFVVTTATSGRQMRAIAEDVERLMKGRGSRPRVGVEGRDSETWILQDYGDIVLHVFSPEGREPARRLEVAGRSPGGSRQLVVASWPT